MRPDADQAEPRGDKRKAAGRRCATGEVDQVRAEPTERAKADETAAEAVFVVRCGSQRVRIDG